MSPSQRPLPRQNGRLRGGLVFLAAAVLLCLWGLGMRNEALEQNLDETLQPPSLRAPFGTDALGRDLFARTAAGGSTSLPLSLLCVASSLGIGTLLGLMSGWLGGTWVDRSLLRLVDVTMAFPGLLLALLVAGLFQGGSWVVFAALVLTGWTEYFRLARSLTCGIRGAAYVEAGRLAGLPGLFILRRYILPEVRPHLLILATLGMGKTILNISSLGFLGIGLSPPQPEWGSMMAEGLPYMRQAPWTVLGPGIAIFCTLFGFYLTGQALARKRKQETLA